MGFYDTDGTNWDPHELQTGREEYNRARDKKRNPIPCRLRIGDWRRSPGTS